METSQYSEHYYLQNITFKANVNDLALADKSTPTLIMWNQKLNKFLRIDFCESNTISNELNRF